MHTYKRWILSILLVLPFAAAAQPTSTGYWQQRAEYTMEIDMDVNTHRFKGKQKLVYHNNSPDTLTKAYYHLYYNAFQPGSMMDVRSLNIEDPDRRVGDRISQLKDNEIGYQHINSLKQDGKNVSYRIDGTILEVTLNKPILPGAKTTFDMDFEAQVPLQIRRTGRDSDEGISYSMTQWYPKLSEYDYLGWHTNPYIGREFHGVWSDFDVKITIDPNYIIGGTGYLQNPQKTGYGYQKEGTEVNKSDKPLTWHFKAPNVHDFAWAADPDYKHTTAQVPGGPTLHFLYQETEGNRENWAKLPELMVKAIQFLNDNFGKYPYDQYTFIQGGDGGMEYPMATLITGNRNFNSLLGVAIHELLHSWYQGVLATNESLYPWMDEGFTSYASDVVIKHLLDPDSDRNPHAGSYQGYFFMANSGKEEPLTTHADMYHSNRSYGINSYSKGAVFLHQLSYVIGQETFMKGMKRYFNTWKFKHPTSIDFIRIMEKVSDIQLDWYLEKFVYTTDQIDYGIKTVIGSDDATYVTLERIGEMMMPVDLYVEYEDGSKEIHYIPLKIMRGAKEVENMDVQRITKEAWPWTHPEYILKINNRASKIKSIEIDPTDRMADIDRSNNSIVLSEKMKAFQHTTK
ncbi:Zn-dependent aminopeptidase [Fulvivirga imtechensis AK7]|uniref:Zn-dependent aminopeptidase n=1 Tax=Fulvivirga imtechensis AK7 TaxID=1237149 RepID=L8JW81_9BACT|nr:M1 family metallopeptidase [Fulvivirga imtechensis]ELR71487.1 Zn-dependent aminopeptidase [Fulvivirga imtechensis AK7]